MEKAKGIAYLYAWLDKHPDEYMDRTQTNPLPAFKTQIYPAPSDVV
jgi:hypothetical protein